MNRRIFIKKTIFPAMMAGLGGANIPNLISMHNKDNKRIRLSENGPMIPPVPAILLTVNGKPGDPKEISVVWTSSCSGHIVNGKWQTR